MRDRVLTCAIVLAISGAVSRPAATPQDFSAVAVRDLDGTTVRPLGSMPANVLGVVFVFTRSDCREQVRTDLERLQRRAAEESVDFWLVFVDPGGSARSRSRAKQPWNGIAGGGQAG